jgi:hypothetical protein
MTPFIQSIPSPSFPHARTHQTTVRSEPHAHPNDLTRPANTSPRRRRGSGRQPLWSARPTNVTLSCFFLLSSVHRHGGAGASIFRPRAERMHVIHSAPLPAFLYRPAKCHTKTSDSDLPSTTLYTDPPIQAPRSNHARRTSHAKPITQSINHPHHHPNQRTKGLYLYTILGLLLFVLLCCCFLPWAAAVVVAAVASLFFFLAACAGEGRFALLGVWGVGGSREKKRGGGRDQCLSLEQRGTQCTRTCPTHLAPPALLAAAAVLLLLLLAVARRRRRRPAPLALALPLQSVIRTPRSTSERPTNTHIPTSQQDTHSLTRTHSLSLT